MDKPFVRDPYNYDRDAASDESGLRCMDKTLTQQHFAEEVDINTIVHRFGLTGEMPLGHVPPMYGDFTGVSDFKSAMDATAKAREAFDAMPAKVRARFENDPQKLIEFVENEENRAEAEKLGLVLPKAAAPAPVAPEPAPAPLEAPKAP